MRLVAEWKKGDEVWVKSLGKKAVVCSATVSEFVMVRVGEEPIARMVGVHTLASLPRNTPAAILREAADLLDGDRQDEYGDVFENHERIASEWSSILGHPVTGGQVAACMVAVKRSRLTQNPQHHDSHVDALAYTAIKSAFDLRPQ